MNTKETIKAKIAQNEVDTKKLTDEKDRLQQKLTELDTPKLKHGDVVSFGGGKRIVIEITEVLRDNSGYKYAQLDEDGRIMNYSDGEADTFTNYTKINNVFED